MTSDETRRQRIILEYWKETAAEFGDLLRQAFEFLPEGPRGDGIRERWLAALEFSGIDRHRKWVERYDEEHKPEIKSF